MVTAIYAGNFDPITRGHLDLIKRSLSFCDRLIVAVGVNSAKKPLFSQEQRLDLISKSIAPREGFFDTRIKVTSFSTLLVDYAKTVDASILIRGIRNVSDFEYEINLAGINKTLAPEIETIFLPTSPELAVVSSSMVKEIAKYKRDVSPFVSECVVKELKNIFNY